MVEVKKSAIAAFINAAIIAGIQGFTYLLNHIGKLGLGQEYQILITTVLTALLALLTNLRKSRSINKGAEEEESDWADLIWFV